MPLLLCPVAGAGARARAAGAAAGAGRSSSSSRTHVLLDAVVGPNPMRQRREAIDDVPRVLIRHVVSVISRDLPQRVVESWLVPLLRRGDHVRGGGGDASPLAVRDDVLTAVDDVADDPSRVNRDVRVLSAAAFVSERKAEKTNGLLCAESCCGLTALSTP